MKKFNLVLCSLSYLPATGGLVSYMKGLAEYAIRNNINVKIFTSNSKDNSQKNIETINDVRVHRCDVFNYSAFLKPFTPFAIVKKIKRQIQANLKDFIDADVIVVRHIYYAVAISEFPGLLQKAVFIVPLISPRLQMINSRADGNIFRRLYGYFLAPQLLFLERRAVSKNKNIATLSLSKKKEVAEFYRLDLSKIKIIEPGIDTARFCPVGSSGRADLLRKYNKEGDEEKTVLLTVCRLVEEKNLSSLILALDYLPQECVLYVVGDGPHREQLESLAADRPNRVFFWGEQTSVEDFYRIANLFILPSTYEGFGHVFLESMACGCPVVGVANNPPFTITATEEIIKNSINGFIANGASPKDLAEAIRNAIKSDLMEIGNNCRDLVVNNYSWEAHLNKIKRNLCIRD